MAFFVSERRMGKVPEIPGCHAVDPTEGSCKIVGIVEATFESDLSNGHIGRTQQVLCPVDPQSVDVLNGCRMIKPLKNGNDPVFRKT